MKSSEPDTVLSALAVYLKHRGVFFSSLISPHRFSERGLGIRAERRIKVGTKLIHVPTSAIVHKSIVPSAFLREGLRPHALLAAYVAFGIMEGRQGVDQEGRQAWMATWPSLEDFRAGMPLLWPQKARETQQGAGRERYAVLSGGITGRWATSPDANVEDMTGQKRFQGFLSSQSRKFYSDVLAISKAFPEREIDVTDFFSHKNEKLVWAWCVVNSRCFYYFTSWDDQKCKGRPSDSDECMVLCPGMDLFNHTDMDGCKVQYDHDGYDVLAAKDYVAGEELFLNYGGHSDEELWVEYAFLLGDDSGEGNRWDGVRIDEIVLRSMSVAQVGALRGAGYEGEYWLRKEGVCWRTEVAARLLVMEMDRWERFVLGRGGKSNTSTNSRKKKRKSKTDLTPKSLANRKIVEWVKLVRSEAEGSLEELGRLDEASQWDLFALQPKSEKTMESPKVQARYEIVLKRWKQIDAICASALSDLEAEYALEGL